MTSVPENPGTPDQPGLFIVGMSRAATTWLAKCLNEHTEAAVFGENGYWGKRFVKPDTDGKYSRAQIDQILAQQRDGRMVRAVVGEGPGNLKHVTTENIGDLLEKAYAKLSPPVTPGELYRAALKAVAQAEGKRIAIDKTPQNVYWISHILQEMPGARFVSMVREPYGFMLSYKYQGKRKGEERWRQFRRLYHPIACSFVWRAYVRASLRSAGEHPDRVLIVRFDEVRENNEDVLRRVQEHFGLPHEDLASRIPPDNTSFPDGKRPTLSGADVFWMNRISKRLRNELQMEGRPVGFHPIQIIISCLTLPIWMVRNVGPFRRAMNISVVRYVLRLVFR